MGLAVDASSPARWTGQSLTNGVTFVSALFTPPSNSLLLLCLSADTWSTETGQAFVLSGGGLTYSALVERTGTEATAGAYAGIWKAPIATGGNPMQVTYTRTATGNANMTGRVSIKAYVLTGGDATTPTDTVGAANEGGSSTNSMTTTSITPGADGLLFVCGTDWQALGGGTTAPTSSDLTKDAATYTGAIDAISGYKATANGVGVTANLDAAGTGTPQWKWVQANVRQAAAGGTFAPAYVFDRPAAMSVLLAL